MSTTQHTSASRQTASLHSRGTRAARRISTATFAAALVGLVLVGPASARQDPGDLIAKQDPTRVSTPTDQPQVPRTQVVTIDDDALEQAQVALGALGGLVVAGAAAGAFTARRRHQHAL